MEPEAGPSTPPRPPPRSRRREARHDASDKAILKSLAASPAFRYLQPRSPGPIPGQEPASGAAEARPKRMLPYRTDEQCRIRCKQTNARRHKGQPPLCKLMCWYRASLPPADLAPGDEDAATGTTPDAPSSPLPSSGRAQVPDREQELARLTDRYAPAWLKGRYLYFAQGEPALIRHLVQMRRWESVEAAWQRQEAHRLRLDKVSPGSPLSPGAAKLDVQAPARLVGPRQPGGVADVTPWVLDESSERVISLADAFGRPFARLHMHLERIYGPVAHRLAKLPALVGSESSPLNAESPLPRTLARFAEKARNGDGLELAWRAMDSVAEVLRRIGHKYSEGSGKSGPDAGPARSGP